MRAPRAGIARLERRASLLLRDVAYRLYADLVVRDDRQDPEPSAKFFEMFERRAKKGQCVNQPYLGCREFAARWRLVERSANEPPPIAETRDLGWMLHDLDFTNPADPQPRFFHAHIERGRGMRRARGGDGAMILQALVGYYERRTSDADPARRLPAQGLEDKEIPFLIELRPDGRVVQLVDTRQPDGRFPRGRRFLVPQGEKKASGVKANLLWDSAEYVIGLERERKSRTAPSPAEAFAIRLAELPVEAQADAGLQAVRAALVLADWSVLRAHPAWPLIEESNPVLSFRLVGDADLICQRPAIARAAQARERQSGEGLCLVEGRRRPIARLHPVIKGVRDAQTSGANVVSFNARAFESYGKTERQGENAPVSAPAVFAYTTALNHLLDRGSRNKVQIGDATTVFWADRATRFDAEFTLADLFGDTDDPDRQVQAVHALLEAVHSGALPDTEGEARFFVLGLAPNASRVAIRFWLQARLCELAPRIAQHFADLAITRQFDSDAATPSLSRLLRALAVQEKADNVPPRVAGEWMRAILEGLPYPAGLLNVAVMRCRAEQATDDPRGNVTYLRAAILKAWLNRDHRRHHPQLPPGHAHFKEQLDVTHPDVPYRLGRLFALLERIQEDSARPARLNATIRDRYYGAASTAPVAVLKRCPPEEQIMSGTSRAQ